MTSHKQIHNGIWLSLWRQLREELEGGLKPIFLELMPALQCLSGCIGLQKYIEKYTIVLNLISRSDVDKH